MYKYIHACEPCQNFKNGINKEKNSLTQASKCHLLHWACMKLAAEVIQEVERHMYTLFET